MIKYRVEARSAALGETALDNNATAQDATSAHAQADCWAQHMRQVMWRGQADWQPHVTQYQEKQSWE
jgi:hypothetical protein